MSLDPPKIIDLLKTKSSAGFFEVNHVQTYHCVRERKDGANQDVTVEIWDAGPEVKPRYSCYATAEDGRKAAGNSRDSVEDAVLNCHWWDLDEEPPAG